MNSTTIENPIKEKQPTPEEMAAYAEYYKNTTPTQRIIDDLPIATVLAEYKLILSKQSNASSSQRKFIITRAEKYISENQTFTNK